MRKAYSHAGTGGQLGFVALLGCMSQTLPIVRFSVLASPGNINTLDTCKVDWARHMPVGRESGLQKFYQMS